MPSVVFYAAAVQSGLQIQNTLMTGSVQETESIPLTEYCRAFLDSVSQGAAVEQRLEAGIGVFRVRKIEEGLVSFIDLGHVKER